MDEDNGYEVMCSECGNHIDPYECAVYCMDKDLTTKFTCMECHNKEKEKNI
jgi:hypothetical protein